MWLNIQTRIKKKICRRERIDLNVLISQSANENDYSPAKGGKNLDLTK